MSGPTSSGVAALGYAALGPDALQDVPESWPVHETSDASRGEAPFAVRRDVISVPDHNDQFTRLIVEHPGAVVVLAIDDTDTGSDGTGRVLVLRQYRHAARRRFIELPAGLLDEPGEDPLAAARRELLEEAALEASDWDHLNTIHNSPGFSSELVEIYLARGLSAVPDRRGFELAHEEADMTVHWVDFDDLLDAVLARRVTDGPLVTAVLTHALRTAGRTPRETAGETDGETAGRTAGRAAGTS